MNDPGTVATELAQDVRKNWRQSRGKNADQLPARPGGIEERADQVQNAGYMVGGEWSAQLDHRSKGGVIIRRGNEAEPEPLQRFAQLVRRQANWNP